MSSLSETRSSPIVRDIHHAFSEPNDQSTAMPWMHCCACNRMCTIPPFDGFLAYGINCVSKPEDLNPEQWLEMDLQQWLH